MRKGSNGGTSIAALVILVVWKRGIVINPKYRLNNAESMDSNDFVM